MTWGRDLTPAELIASVAAQAGVERCAVDLSYSAIEEHDDDLVEIRVTVTMPETYGRGRSHNHVRIHASGLNQEDLVTDLQKQLIEHRRRTVERETRKATKRARRR